MGHERGSPHEQEWESSMARALIDCLVSVGLSFGLTASAVSCNAPATPGVDAAPPPASGRGMPSGAELPAELLAPPSSLPSKPTSMVGGFGTESAEIGVRECDELFRLVRSCAERERGMAGPDGILARMKQVRLGWKFAAMDAGRDQERLTALGRECALSRKAMGPELIESGCIPADGRGGRIGTR
jgi:hypothetical protein